MNKAIVCLTDAKSDPSHDRADALLANQWTLPSGFRVTVRWGRISDMPRCEHGRVICSACDLPTPTVKGSQR